MKNVSFSTFWTSCFYSLERSFFVVEYRKRHFPGLYCLKKICWKNGHFFSKPWVHPFGKMAIFQLFEPFFYSLERRFFVLEYRKGHFPMLYCRKKKKDGKIKKVNFSNFWTSCFYSLKRLFFVLEYRKRHFFGLYYLKIKVGKMVIFGTKAWINPFGKIPIFWTVWSSDFYILERCFFVLEYRKRPFRSLYCPKKKKWKNGHFWTKSMVLPIWKNVNIHGVNPWFWSKNGPFSNFSF